MKTTKKKQLISIEVNEEFFQEYVDAVAEGLGYQAKTVVQTQEGQRVAVTNNLSKEDWLKQHVTQYLDQSFVRGAKTLAAREASEKANKEATEKLKNK